MARGLPNLLAAMIAGEATGAQEPESLDMSLSKAFYAADYTKSLVPFKAVNHNYDVTADATSPADHTHMDHEGMYHRCQPNEARLQRSRRVHNLFPNMASNGDGLGAPTGLTLEDGYPDPWGGNTAVKVTVNTSGLSYWFSTKTLTVGTKYRGSIWIRRGSTAPVGCVGIALKPTLAPTNVRHLLTEEWQRFTQAAEVAAAASGLIGIWNQVGAESGAAGDVFYVAGLQLEDVSGASNDAPGETVVSWSDEPEIVTRDLEVDDFQNLGATIEKLASGAIKITHGGSPYAAVLDLSTNTYLSEPLEVGQDYLLELDCRFSSTSTLIDFYFDDGTVDVLVLSNCSNNFWQKQKVHIRPKASAGLRFFFNDFSAGEFIIIRGLSIKRIHHPAAVPAVRYFDTLNSNYVESTVLVREGDKQAISRALLGGYLREDARANLVANSCSFVSWTQIGTCPVTISTGPWVGTFGRMSWLAGNGAGDGRQSPTVTVVQGNRYSLSVEFAKGTAATLGVVGIILPTTQVFGVDISWHANGDAYISGSISAFPAQYRVRRINGERWRLEMQTPVVSVGNNAMNIFLYPNRAGGGVLGTYFYAAQAELGYTPSSFIFTDGTGVKSRAIDRANLPAENYRDNMVIVGEIDFERYINWSDYGFGIIGMWEGGTKYVSIALGNTGVFYAARQAGSGFYLEFASVMTSSGRLRFAVQVNEDHSKCKTFVNGKRLDPTPASASGSGPIVPSHIELGWSGDINDWYSDGNLGRIEFFDGEMTDEQLAEKSR